MRTIYTCKLLFSWGHPANFILTLLLLIVGNYTNYLKTGVGYPSFRTQKRRFHYRWAKVSIIVKRNSASRFVSTSSVDTFCYQRCFIILHIFNKASSTMKFLLTLSTFFPSFFCTFSSKEIDVQSYFSFVKYVKSYKLYGFGFFCLICFPIESSVYISNF